MKPSFNRLWRLLVIFLLAWCSSLFAQSSLTTGGSPSTGGSTSDSSGTSFPARQSIPIMPSTPSLPTGGTSPGINRGTFPTSGVPPTFGAPTAPPGGSLTAPPGGVPQTLGIPNAPSSSTFGTTPVTPGTIIGAPGSVAPQGSLGITGGLPIPQQALPPQLRSPSAESQIQGEGTPGELQPGSPVDGAATAPASDLSPLERLFAGQFSAIDTNLRQFGYDLFTRVPTTFAPVTDVPVGPDYIVGPGDNLNIVLWGGTQETAYQAEVDRNGAITLPRLGVVQVWGLTLDQAQRLLQQRFKEFFPTFQMVVTLGKLRTVQVYVVGEVQQPGTYTISSLSTMINALFASGGPTKNGTLRRIQLVRQGRTLHTLDLYDFLLLGDKSQDKPLQSGDTIFVPVIGAVAGVAGHVKRPAIYEFQPGTTLRQMLELAGGVTPLGYLQQVQVERTVANEKKVIADLNLSAPQRQLNALWQTPMADGDLVRIFAITTLLENVVTLEGHVKRPGRYELKPGMHLHDIITSYRDLLPEAYLDYAELVRLEEPSLRPTVMPFNLKALLDNDPAHNVRLQRQDVIRIFPKTAFADLPKVTISGQVRQPGIYEWIAGMQVRDLVARAGWVTKDAYLERAEVIRLTPHRELISVPFHLGRALEGQSSDNLALQDEDSLLIQDVRTQGFPRRVQVSGLVTTPGLYPLTRDMRISDLIFRAGGTTKFAYLEKAELTRRDISQGGDIAVRIEVSLQKALVGDPEHNLLLQDLDQLLVRSIPDLEQVQTVTLLGEVRFPGVYPVLKGERLSSVLQRAGGFTPEAYPRGAVLTRPSAKAAQERRLRQLIEQEEAALLTEGIADIQTALTPQEATIEQQGVIFRRQLLARLRTVQPEGRVVIRLHSLERFAGSENDIELEPGDQLTIPQVPKYVNVLGEVFNEVALSYEPGKKVADYLKAVGGIKSEALEREIYLVQLNGTVISNSQSQFAITSPEGETKRFRDFFAVEPLPGDSIVVPRQTKTPATLRNIRDIAQILFQSLSSVAVIVSVF